VFGQHNVKTISFCIKLFKKYVLILVHQVEDLVIQSSHHKVAPQITSIQVRNWTTAKTRA